MKELPKYLRDIKTIFKDPEFKRNTDGWNRHSLLKKDCIEEILKYRLEKGWTRVHIRNHIMKDWEIPESHAEYLMKQAAVEFDRIAIQSFEKDLKEDIERFEVLYENAVKKENFSAALKILSEISKLKGHYIERIDLNVTEITAKFPGLFEEDKKGDD
jgi:hypothetical protein